MTTGDGCFHSRMPHVPNGSVSIKSVSSYEILRICERRRYVHGHVCLMCWQKEGHIQLPTSAKGCYTLQNGYHLQRADSLSQRYTSLESELGRLT